MSTFRRVTQFVFPSNTKDAQENAMESSVPQKSMFQPSKRAALGDIGNQKPSLLSGKSAGISKRSKVSRGREQPLARDSIHAHKHTIISLDKKKASSVHDILRDDSEFMDTQEDSSALKTPPRLFVAPVPADVHDIDQDDIGNPQQCAEYVGEIYAYMMELERRHAVPADHLSIQAQNVKPQMRAILVDWLQEVHQRFKLIPETMYLTVDILDRFLAIQPIARTKLQLVGVTSMLIASKYEEMYPPDVGDYQFISNGAYSRAEILAMEGLILKTLDFNLGTPLPLQFLRRLSKASDADAHIHAVAKYLMELKLVDYEMVNILPSQTACAALWISRKMLCDDAPWSSSLQHYSTYSEAEVLPAVEQMHRVLANSVNPTNEQQAVNKKYASKKYLSISTLPVLSSYISNL